MGRLLQPITISGPIPDFAKKLRDRRATAGMPTFREMAKVSHFSHTSLAKAVAGQRLPSLTLVRAFLTALGADEDELHDWAELWRETRRADQLVAHELGELAAARRDAQPPTEQTPPPVLANPNQIRPHPERVLSFEDLHYELQVLRLAAGNPSLTMLGRILNGNVARSTLADVLAGRRVPRFRTLTFILTALFARLPTIDHGSWPHNASWTRLGPWSDAWRRAEFTRTRPDLKRRRARNVVLVTTGKDDGSTAAVVAKMDPAHAAELLASMPPDVSAAILTEMPTRKAQAVLVAMQALTEKANAVPPDGITL